MKKILITGGPTNEYIDEVMKITNMSTGSLSLSLGEIFSKNEYYVTLILNHSVHINELQGNENIKIVKIETTNEMLEAILKESQNSTYDIIIHAAAVGDYKGEFSFIMEDMANEIYSKINNINSSEDVLDILTNPDCKINDESKISSYQKNLTCKLTLTPKIIAKLKEWFPNALLIGCKLLDNVPKKELFDVAQNLATKNNMDYILANDLHDLRSGDKTRYLVTKQGYTGIELLRTEDIYNFISALDE